MYNFVEDARRIILMDDAQNRMVTKAYWDLTKF